MIILLGYTQVGEPRVGTVVPIGLKDITNTLGVFAKTHQCRR